MLSVNNQRQTPVLPAGIIQIDDTLGERVSEETSMTESPKMDTVTISERPETPVYERPVNFFNNFGHLYEDHNVLAETDLFVRLRNRLPVLFDDYFAGNTDKESLLRTLDHAVSDLVAYYGNKGFDPADITQDVLKDLYENCRIQWFEPRTAPAMQRGERLRRRWDAPVSRSITTLITITRPKT